MRWVVKNKRDYLDPIGAPGPIREHRWVDRPDATTYGSRAAALSHAQYYGGRVVRLVARRRARHACPGDVFLLPKNCRALGAIEDGPGRFMAVFYPEWKDGYDGCAWSLHGIRLSFLQFADTGEHAFVPPRPQDQRPKQAVQK